MTRKDYIKIAAAIQETNVEELDGLAYRALHATALRLCEVFKQDNPNFDKGRFLKACGFGG